MDNIESVENAENNETNKKTQESITFLGSLSKYVQEYCEISTIQGLSYLAKTNSVIDCLWWLIILSLCVGGCTSMICQIFDKWFTTPVLFSLGTKEAPISLIPFPSVTICPESKISTKCLNYSKILVARNYNRLQNTTFEENKLFDYMALLCRPENYEGSLVLANRSILEMFNETHADDRYPQNFAISDYSDFLYECSSVKINDSICQWMGRDMPCKDIMKPIITEEGLCYTFNMLDIREIYTEITQMKYFEREKKATWRPDWGYKKKSTKENYPRRAFLNGAKNAFVAVFLTKKEEIDFGCQHFSLQGMRVSINNPARIPRPSQVFFSVGLNKLTTAAVSPTLTYVSKSVIDYPPHTRNCYFTFERKLKYFKRYSQGNCNIECLANYTAKFCNCVSFYMPRDNQTRICSLQERSCITKARVSYPQVILSQRLNKTKEGISNDDSSHCDCIPICSEVKYNAELASGVWDYNNPDEALFDAERETYDQYYASAVKVYFKDPYFLPTHKDELYGITDVISDCGGILGLFTGFSIFSIAEIIYYLSIRLYENYRKFGYWAGPKD